MERWQPDSERWRPGPPLPRPGLGLGAVRQEGRTVLVVGGMLEPAQDTEAPWQPADAVIRWEEDHDRWVPQRGLETARYLHETVALPAGELLVLGGLAQGAGPGDLCALASVERRGRDGCWSVCAPLARPIAEPVAAVLEDGRVLVCGGYDEQVTPFAGVYDPSRDCWDATEQLPSPRAGHRAVRLAGDRVLIVGGCEALGGPAVISAELWDPRTSHWTTLAGPRWPRIGHTATLLDDGRVLVAGGQEERDNAGAAEIWRAC